MEKEAPFRKTKEWVWNVELKEWIFEETKEDF